MNPDVALVDDICQHLPEYRQFDDLAIRTRHLDPHCVLFTLHGQHVLSYITKSLEQRCIDPYTHASDVTRALFQRLFGDRYAFTFNQRLTLERALLVPRLEELVKNGWTIERLLHEYKADPDALVTVEIDADIQLDMTGESSRRFEIKLFTCPGQSGRVLEQHLYPGVLGHLFVARDYAGFITFGTLHDATDPSRPPRYPDRVPAGLRTGWFLHFAVVDARVLRAPGTARERANRIISEMRNDHAFFVGKLELNTHDCSTSLIENYVKVIHMAYVIEQLRRDLEEERRLRVESERQRQESERQRQESERQQQESERQRQESERQKNILLKALRDAGIPSPLDGKDTP